MGVIRRGGNTPCDGHVTAGAKAVFDGRGAPSLGLPFSYGRSAASRPAPIMGCQSYYSSGRRISNVRRSNCGGNGSTSDNVSNTRRHQNDVLRSSNLFAGKRCHSNEFVSCGTKLATPREFTHQDVLQTEFTVRLKY
jgi:hypothetical protein